MRRSWLLCLVGAGLVSLVGGEACAQRRDVTVQYLKAALGSIADRDRVSLDAEYSVEAGLTEARGSYLRNKGFSRFTVLDPVSGAEFGSAYCEHDSKVFNELLGVKEKKRFIFAGYKGKGEGREDAIFVTSVTPLSEPRQPPAKEKRQTTTYRVTMIDHVSSNRTVLVNIELGKRYNVMGTTLVLEDESQTADRIGVK